MTIWMRLRFAGFSASADRRMSAAPALHRLAVRRFLRANRRLRQEPPVARMRLEDDLYRMLPSDWPLWVEASRPLRTAVSH